MDRTIHPSRLSRWIGPRVVRWIGRLLGGLGLLLLAALVLVAGLLLFPPSELLRRAALPIARQVLHHDNLDIGAIELDLLRRVEIRDIWLGPPKGYHLPLATIKRVVAEYDIGQIASQRVVVRQVQVERPVLRVEADAGGKLNWLAFIEGLGPSEPKPEEPPGEPSEIVVEIQRVAVTGVALYFDDGKQRALLDGLHLGVHGIYGPADSRLEVVVQLAAPSAEHPNIGVKLQQPQALLAKLDAGILLRARIDDLAPPRLGTTLDFRLATRALQGPWQLDPLALGLHLAAGFDQGADRATVDALTFDFNDERLLDLRAQADQVLAAERRVELLLDKLHLPLDKLAPYARAVLPHIRFGGTIAVNKLQLAGRVDQIQQPRRLAGELAIDDVWARVGTPDCTDDTPRCTQAAIEGLAGRLRFGARRVERPAPLSPDRLREQLLASDDAPQERARPALRASGRIEIAAASAPGVKIERLALDLAAAMDRTSAELGTFASRIALEIPRARYRDRALGSMRTSLRTELVASGDLRRENLAIDRLALDIDRRIRLRLSAALAGRERFEAKLALLPLNLGRLIARLPRGLRAKLGGRRIAGSLGLDLSASGTLPDMAEGSPLARRLAADPVGLFRDWCCSRASPLGLRFDLGLTLRDLGLRDPSQGLSASGLGGKLELSGRQGRLRLETRLALARLDGTGLAVRQLDLPLQLQLDGRGPRLQLGVSADRIAASGATLSKLSLETRLRAARRAIALPRPRDPPLPLQLDLELSIARAAPAAGVKLADLSLNKSLEASVPLGRLASGRPAQLGPLSLALQTRIGRTNVAQPGLRLAVSAVDLETKLAYAPAQRRPLRLSLALGAKRIDHTLLALRVDDARLRFDTRVGGIKLAVPHAPPQIAALSTGATRLEIAAGKVRQRGVIEPPLSRNSVKLRARLARGGKLLLDRLAVRVPSRGLRLDAKARVEELARLVGGRPFVPPLDVELRAALDNPRATRPRAATLLTKGLRSAGKVGLSLRARRTRPGRLRLDGRLIADAFHLWQRSITTTERAGGGLLRNVAVLHLENFNADVPIEQELDFAPATMVVSLPPARGSIFEAGARSTLYRALRPYAARRANFALNGITLDERLTAMTDEGHLINTRSRKTRVGKIALDLAIAHRTFLLSRLYLDLFGGDVAGSVQAQLVGPVIGAGIPDTRLKLGLQATGIDLSYLTAEKKGQRGESEISALIDLKVRLAKRYVAGRIEIPQISLKQLDSLLAYLDPNNVDESIKKNREMINSWYMKIAKVKLVSIWIEHGNLNMDIEMDAIPPLGAYIRKVLKDNRIRRFNILPLLGGTGSTQSSD